MPTAGDGSMLEDLDLFFFHILFSMGKYTLQLLREGQRLQPSVLLGMLLSSTGAGSSGQDVSCEYWQGAVRAPFFLGSVSSLLLLP